MMMHHCIRSGAGSANVQALLIGWLSGIYTARMIRNPDKRDSTSQETAWYHLIAQIMWISLDY